MMSPIGQYLTEFRPAGIPDFAPPSLAEADAGDALEFDLEDDAFPLAADPLDDQVEPHDEHQAAEDVQADVEANPGLSFDAAIEALKSEHAAELASARQQWAESEGMVLAARMAQCFDDLEKRLGDTLAPLLEPFLAKAAQSKVLDQLRSTIDTLLAAGDHPPITVSGPDDLITAIKAAYPGEPTLAFQASDQADVTITMGDSRIRSQLRAWARKLDAALGAPR